MLSGMPESAGAPHHDRGMVMSGVSGHDGRVSGSPHSPAQSRRPVPPDWRLVRLGKAGGLLEYEQIVLDGLFKDAETGSGKTSVLLSRSGGAYAVLRRARDAMYREMTARGWYTARPDRVRRTWGLISVTVLCASLAAEIPAVLLTGLGLVSLPLILAALTLAALIPKMPERTAAGNHLARQARGFRSYLKTLAMQQACPAGQPGLLYDYIPYAIAFGCASQWDEMGAALTEDAGPAWYRGHGDPFALTAFATTASSGSGAGGGGFGGGGFGGTLIWNQQHLLHALREFERFYNGHRRPAGTPPPTPPIPGGRGTGRSS